MSKPDDIPQDVWDRSEGYFDQFLSMGQESFRPAVQVIARAIMAAKAEEREACLAIADDVASKNQGYSDGPGALRVADLIRREATP